MSTAWVLNVIGLLISTAAAVLMYYFPPRVLQYTEKGEPQITFVGNSTEQGKRVGAWQGRWSKVAPALLALGFLLQLFAALIPVLWPSDG